jgi:outer membrane protein assembly factor BamE (lipoprotein component of BamABCDE complex)
VRKILTVLGCLIIFAAFVGADSSGCEEIDKSEKSSAQVTAKKVKEVKLGDSKKEVRAALGKPENTDRMESEGMTMECWYYGVLADRSWQFCFDDGKLSSKNRY